MGSFSSFYIGEYEAFCSKNSYSENIVNALFCESDFIQEYNKEGVLTEIRFRCTAKTCKERLEILGVNLKSVRDNFNQIIKYIKDDPGEFVYFGISDFTFEEYLQTAKEVIGENIKESDEEKYEGLKKYLIRYQCYLYAGYGDECCLTENNWLYILLSCVDSQTNIYYDLTSIASGGWIPTEAQELLNTDKIVVLTEGKTDTEFIKAGFELFYPHLLPFYQFIDYEEIKLSGSASFLAQIAKALVGVEAKNKAIILFDNDAVGYKESSTLSSVKLPTNIKVMHYPDIENLRLYPVVGIDGNKCFDVNGIAGSIEMYLGIDVLKQEDDYFPVYLSEYIPGINRYQGALSKLNKIEVQNKFREKLRQSKLKGITQVQDWSGIKEIINKLMHAWD